jgi:type VI secretion system protein ImpL
VIWRLLIFEIVAVAVVVGVWFGGPLVGLTSVVWRVVIICALLIPPIAFIIWNFFNQRKAAKGLEHAIKEQGRAHREAVRPDRRAEIEVLGDVFDKAVASLKKSKVGSGASALYALPWYMIIGPPAAGKSTALLHSGLKFPFTTGDRKAIKGVGGTRNCDWWFSDQAILLDTAGRYTSEDEDQEEWIAFLRLLKRYRKKRPLNGLIVAASIVDLIRAKPDELEEMANRLRARIDQVIEELDLALPVYILFTKCDLVSGFIQFFGDLTKTTRSQIFGFTIPLTAAGPEVEGLFNAEFDLLVGKLRERAMHRLASAKSQQRREVYQFPLQFSATRNAFAAFVSQVMVQNPYLETPRLRGVYWCSGTQEGRPVDKVMAVMSRALGLRELASDSFEQSTQKKSYFLRDVFTQVLFPDHDLAGTTALGRSRRKKLGVVALAASVLISTAIVAPALITFANNRQLASTSVDVARRSRITTPEDPRRVLDGLKALDRLGVTLDQLRRYERDGAPWWLGLGFYHGHKLLDPVEKIYVRRMRQAFVMPAGTELEATLIDVANTNDATATGAAANDFDLLKTYLMVTEPARLDIKFASPILLVQWKKRLHPDVAQDSELLLGNARRYLQLCIDGKARWLDRDKDVVRNVRHALRARDAEYRTLIGTADKEMRPLTLRDALRGRVQTVITGSAEVPGVYTRAGWSQYIQVRLAKQLAAGSKIEPWVLGEEAGRDVTDRLKERYFEQYIIAWQRFLKGLAIEQASTAEDSKRLLDKLTEPPSLYVELFTAVAYNTELPLVEVNDELRKQLGGTKAGQLAAKAKKLGLTAAVPKVPQNRVERTFQPLRELAVTAPGADGRQQISGIQQYVAQLEIVRTELEKDLKAQGPADSSGLDKAIEEAQRVTRGILATLPGDLRRVIGPLFYTPLEVTSGTAKKAQGARTAGSFSNELCAFYSERLAGKYPFGKSRTDALFQDAVSFFSPKGTVWNYYNDNLKTQLLRKGDIFAAAPGKTLPGHIVGFYNQAWRITRAFYPMGSETPGFRFQVRPRPAVLEAGSTFQISEIILEVEGKPQTYRNGPTEQWTFDWKGEDKRSRLLVRGAGGLHEELSFQGDWSLMRLVDRGAIQKRGSWYTVEWSVRGGKIRIPMDFRPDRTYNPLFMTMRLSCR